MGYLSNGDCEMNMDSVKNADYKGMLAKATDVVRSVNDKFDEVAPEPWKSVGVLVLGAVVVASTTGAWTWVVLGSVVGVRLWGTLRRS